ncbi:methyltransferase, putative [Myxococcus hansupus]|uniref:Methyltransferase, putative n=1 Tax=Pseudomyxococcus hansupus TaxID=1297742 RepID=A0A0H4X3R3_9BACT|nr:methyltransferase domain-containing protein [Myxococcus hansupus]AKQ68290.1 methyltransferase, putative [Myxococcus hansupus]
MVTTRAVAAGEVLLVVEGALVRTPSQMTLQVGREQHLSAPDADWRFINHACAPTALLAPGTHAEQLQLIARFDLEPGQEVTFNYLTSEWELATPFHCRCGATTCVGWVRGARYLSAAQRDALRGELLPHIRDHVRGAPEPAPWYRDAFSITDDVWYQPLDAVASEEVERTLRLLDLKPGASILDVCCGHGRHSIELARLGFQVTGLDLSSERLGMARERAARAGVAVTWLNADMRSISAPQQDAVMVLYTSFGVLESDAEHLTALRSIHDALAPGGQLLIEADNRDHAIHQPPRQWGETESLLWWEENVFEPRTSRNHRSYWGRNSRTGTLYEQHINYRLFSAHELLGLIEQAGLRVADVWGDLDGRPFTVGSPMLVVRARRPDARP